MNSLEPVTPVEARREASTGVKGCFEFKDADSIAPSGISRSTLNARQAYRNAAESYSPQRLLGKLNTAPSRTPAEGQRCVMVLRLV